MVNGMRQYRLELGLGVVFMCLFLALCAHMSPGGKLTAAEVDVYMARLQAGLTMPEPERGEFIARLRAWGEADDGEPVYLANLIRYNEQLTPWPGQPVDAETARAAHDVYLEAVIPLVLKLGTYPVIGTDMQGMIPDQPPRSNLSGYEPALDGWSEFNINRYRDRRALLELLSDPVYLAVMPYKFAAMKLVNAPTSVRVLMPDPRLLLGAVMLIIYLLVGWVRSAGRTRRASARRSG